MQRRMQDGDVATIDDAQVDLEIAKAEEALGPDAARALKLKMAKAAEQQARRAQKEALNKSKQL